MATPGSSFTPTPLGHEENVGVGHHTRAKALQPRMKDIVAYPYEAAPGFGGSCMGSGAFYVFRVLFGWCCKNCDESVRNLSTNLLRRLFGEYIFAFISNQLQKR
ncbi:hypothetical protein TNCV_4957201 [Trichonephila clavipes]|nr:hypothetical protein TNCV_4957201 [Trichonephila clavipes]